MRTWNASPVASATPTPPRAAGTGVSRRRAQLRKQRQSRIIPTVAIGILNPGKDPLTPSPTPTFTHDVLATPLDQLLRRASQYRLLEPKEEIELAKRIERGDLGAKDLLVNSNLRLVVSVARHYVGQGLTLYDL